MQTIDIDLKQNPDIANLVADLEPGAKIELSTSIKAKDDQTLTLTIESASEGEDTTDDKAEKEPEAPSSDDMQKPPVTMIPDEP